MFEFFDIFFTEEGVFLEFKPNALEDTLLRGVIAKYIMKKGLADVNFFEVANALKTPGLRRLIAPAQDERKLNEEVSVSISADKMTAYLTFSPADGGNLLTYDDMVDALCACGVVYGYDETQLRALDGNERKLYDNPVPVASGYPAINGEDAFLEYHFRLSRDKMPRILEDGSVDHKNLNLFENVRKDTLLVTLHPQTLGTPGSDVMGNELRPQPGRQVKLPKGANTVISQDGLSLLSEIDGNVELIGGKVTVLRVFTVNGDVGPATGNIDFFGDVIIHGNVLSRYKVVATGTVDITGVVELATVKADGNIIIRRGVKGKSECAIVAGGDVTAKFIENAHVTAMGIIRADVIMNSTVSSFDTVHTSGKYGIIVGGVTRATKLILANDVGNLHMTPTVLEVGITPSSRARYAEACKELTATKANLNQLAGLIARLETLQKRGSLTREQREKFLSYQESTEKYSQRLVKQTQEIAHIKQLLDETAIGSVHVKNNIYSGVTVTIGNISERLTSSFQYCSLSRGDDKLDLSSYSYNK